jgi:hypothetical protein
MPRAIMKNRKNPTKMPRIAAAITRRSEGLGIFSAIEFFLHLKYKKLVLVLKNQGRDMNVERIITILDQSLRQRHADS